MWEDLILSVIKMAKILMVIAPENFRDEEFLVPKEHFEEKGHIVVVASTKKGECKGMLGARAVAERSLNEVKAEDYDAIVFVGGAGTPLVRKENSAIALAKDAFAKGKIVAAICWAPTILAKAGLLKGKKATLWIGQDYEYGSTTADYLKKEGATVLKQPVVVDGKIITAEGPHAAKKFAEEIEKMLSG